MNPKTFERVAIALHGPQWKRATARDLGVTSRALGYYMAGRTIPAEMPQRLAALVALKIAALESVAALLAKEARA